MKEFIDSIRDQVKLAFAHFFIGNIAAFSLCRATNETLLLSLSGTCAGLMVEAFWYSMDENSKNKTALVELRKIVEYTSGSLWFVLIKFLGSC